MRYAEILMMKAECLVRLNKPAEAKPLVAEIRKRAGLATTPDITLEVLDKEWLHEFVFEGLRRSVNIRFGSYFNAGWQREACSRDMGIYPIPASEITSNPKLKQNPGY
jgi:hypothetical protein